MSLKVYRIRKLTPRECYRLMGVNDDEIKKLIDTGLKDSNHYKLAGNSIVVNCMTNIFEKLFYTRSERKEVTLW